MWVIEMQTVPTGSKSDPAQSYKVTVHNPDHLAAHIGLFLKDQLGQVNLAENPPLTELRIVVREVREERSPTPSSSAVPKKASPPPTTKT